MKLLRPVAIAVVLVGGFFYFTTYKSGTFRTINSPTAKVEITEAASNNPLDADEQHAVEELARHPAVLQVRGQLDLAVEPAVGDLHVELPAARLDL